jgi:hypothetical protein
MLCVKNELRRYFDAKLRIALYAAYKNEQLIFQIICEG